jgi:hypothetical protein
VIAEATHSVSGSCVSGAFMEKLQEQMEGWLRSLTDGKITAREASFVSGMTEKTTEAEKTDFFNVENNSSSDSLVQAESAGATRPGDQVLYDGAAAQLFASTRITDIVKYMNFAFNLLKQQNELYDKISGMMGG